MKFYSFLFSLLEVSSISQRGHREASFHDEIAAGLSYVTALNSHNYETIVSTGWTFVKFHVPYCAHCKKLQPEWEKLAKTVHEDTDDYVATLFRERAESAEQVERPFSGIFQDYLDYGFTPPSLRIAEVNCDESSDLCKSLGVDRYPMLGLNTGERFEFIREEHLGGRDRTHANLLAFVQDALVYGLHATISQSSAANTAEAANSPSSDLGQQIMSSLFGLDTQNVEVVVGESAVDVDVAAENPSSQSGKTMREQLLENASSQNKEGQNEDDLVSKKKKTRKGRKKNRKGRKKKSKKSSSGLNEIMQDSPGKDKSGSGALNQDNSEAEVESELTKLDRLFAKKAGQYVGNVIKKMSDKKPSDRESFMKAFRQGLESKLDMNLSNSMARSVDAVLDSLFEKIHKQNGGDSDSPGADNDSLNDDSPSGESEDLIANEVDSPQSETENDGDSGQENNPKVRKMTLPGIPGEVFLGAIDLGAEGGLRDGLTSFMENIGQRMKKKNEATGGKTDKNKSGKSKSSSAASKSKSESRFSRGKKRFQYGDSNDGDKVEEDVSELPIARNANIDDEENPGGENSGDPHYPYILPSGTTIEYDMELLPNGEIRTISKSNVASSKKSTNTTSSDPRRAPSSENTNPSSGNLTKRPYTRDIKQNPKLVKPKDPVPARRKSGPNKSTTDKKASTDIYATLVGGVDEYLCSENPFVLCFIWRMIFGHPSSYGYNYTPAVVEKYSGMLSEDAGLDESSLSAGDGTFPEDGPFSENFFRDGSGMAKDTEAENGIDHRASEGEDWVSADASMSSFRGFENSDPETDEYHRGKRATSDVKPSRKSSSSSSSSSRSGSRSTGIKSSASRTGARMTREERKGAIRQIWFLGVFGFVILAVLLYKFFDFEPDDVVDIKEQVEQQPFQQSVQHEIDPDCDLYHRDHDRDDYERRIEPQMPRIKDDFAEFQRHVPNDIPNLERPENERDARVEEAIQKLIAQEQLGDELEKAGDELQTARVDENQRNAIGSGNGNTVASSFPSSPNVVATSSSSSSCPPLTTVTGDTEIRLNNAAAPQPSIPSSQPSLQPVTKSRPERAIAMSAHLAATEKSVKDSVQLSKGSVKPRDVENAGGGGGGCDSSSNELSGYVSDSSSQA